MHSQHVVFQSPENTEAKIWRYMDFTKFVSLLEDQSLFFTRADRFEDPYEGKFSQFNIQNRSVVYSHGEDTWKQFDIFSEFIRKFTHITCWHMNEYESAAMWKLYLNSVEGVAIQSSFKRLCDCFSKTEEEIMIGKVSYIDYDREWMPEKNALYPYVHKRKSFEYEQEIRAVIIYLPTTEHGIDYSAAPLPYGKLIPVILNELIETIYVAPTAPTWFKELVISVTNKYGLEKPIIQSTLYKVP